MEPRPLGEPRPLKPQPLLGKPCNLPSHHVRTPGVLIFCKRLPPGVRRLIVKLVLLVIRASQVLVLRPSQLLVLVLNQMLVLHQHLHQLEQLHQLSLQLQQLHQLLLQLLHQLSLQLHLQQLHQLSLQQLHQLSLQQLHHLQPLKNLQQLHQLSLQLHLQEQLRFQEQQHLVQLRLHSTKSCPLCQMACQSNLLNQPLLQMRKSPEA